MSFTAQVREELAHAPAGPRCCRTAETVAILRLGGALHLSGAGAGWVVDLGDGAVARRLHTSLTELFEIRPEVEVHRRSALRGQRYRLAVPPPADEALRRLGLLDGDGRPFETVPRALVRARHDAAAFLRGAIMAAGSLSDPRRPAHLEVRVPNEPTAELVCELLARAGADGAKPSPRDDGWRVALKSGEAVGAVLARGGAHTSFLAWDAARLQRELRGEANRATNADRANLQRTSAAAAAQVAAIEQLVAEVGWDGIPDDLAATALTRLANPEATLGELAALHDPPVAKATVHRRLARIADLAGAADAFQGDR